MAYWRMPKYLVNSSKNMVILITSIQIQNISWWLTKWLNQYSAYKWGGKTGKERVINYYYYDCDINEYTNFDACNMCIQNHSSNIWISKGYSSSNQKELAHNYYGFRSKMRLLKHIQSKYRSPLMQYYCIKREAMFFFFMEVNGSS